MYHRSNGCFGRLPMRRVRARRGARASHSPLDAHWGPICQNAATHTHHSINIPRSLRSVIQRCLRHDPGELLEADLAVSVGVKLVDHRLQIVVCQVLAQLTCNPAHVTQRYAA